MRDAFDPRRAATGASDDRPTIGAEVSVAAPVADPILQVENLQVRFATPTGNTDALRGVSFGIARGEVLALVGESGSGKSVSALSILGLLPGNATHPAGRIRFQDEDLLGADEARLEHLRGNRISMIFQEPMTSLNPLHTIHKQVQEAILIHRPIRPQDARAESETLLASAGLEMKRERGDPYPHELSGGQRQRVMIAMALANGPDLLIADEPTTAVDVTIQAQLLELLADLREKRGMAMLFITHDLGIVRRIADRVCVMQAGRIVESGATTEVLKNPQHDYTRHLLAAEPRGRPAPVSSNAPTIAETESLKVWFPIRRGIFGRPKSYVHAVDGVSLAIREGETLGIVGESGSGKSTLGQAWLHLIPSQGSIRFATNSAEAGDPLGRTAPEGSDGSAGSPSVERTAPQQRDSSTGSLREQDDGSARNAREQRRDLRRMAQIVFQDPYGSLSPRLSVAQVTGEGLEVHGLAAGAEECERRVIEALEEVELDPEVRHRYPHEFSGGQRQRIAIARAMILRPRLVILDEPTSALDVSVQAQVTDLLKDLQRRHGTSYLFISHDLRVIRAMSHRVAVMKDGKIIEQADTETLFTTPQTPYTRTLIQAALSP
ncbi:MAG: ABC transporter ATP-binding protein [bacterium]